MKQMLADIDTCGTDCVAGSGLSPRPPKTPTAIRHGKALFARNCQGCHSMGVSNAGTEPVTNLDPPPTNLLNLQDYKYGTSEREITARICYGVEGTAMAPWDGILEPDDIWAVAFYVASQQKKKRVDHK